MTKTEAETSHRSCPLCDHDNRATPPNEYSTEPWPLKTCAYCGFVYIENAPSYSALSDEFGWDKTFHLWHAQRSKSPGQVLLSSLGKRIRRATRVFVRRKRMDDLLVRHAAPGNVLDVGCGKGSQLARLPEAYRPFGIEISPIQAQHATAVVAARGGEILVQPGAKGLFLLPERFFTGVMMRSYLEHEADPKRALIGAARVLAPGGVLIIKVPNYGSLNRRVFGRHWCGFRFPDHLNYFTPDSLCRLCEAAGLAIRKFGVLDRLPTGDNMWLIAGKR